MSMPLIMPSRPPIWTTWGQGMRIRPRRWVSPTELLMGMLRKRNGHLLKTAGGHLARSCGSPPVCCQDFTHSCHCACPEGPSNEQKVPGALSVNFQQIFECQCGHFDEFGVQNQDWTIVGHVDGTYAPQRRSGGGLSGCEYLDDTSQTVTIRRRAFTGTACGDTIETQEVPLEARVRFGTANIGGVCGVNTVTLGATWGGPGGIPFLFFEGFFFDFRAECASSYPIQVDGEQNCRYFYGSPSFFVMGAFGNAIVDV